ncbi:MAG: peptide ABC transporter substrate-binding protein [Verrucomicrobiales bacterium]|nr:peptide ABC transporter substrate-binding protein [Verrucomicrobiales bacterium]
MAENRELRLGLAIDTVFPFRSARHRPICPRMRQLCCLLILLFLGGCSRPPNNVETGARYQVLHLGNGAEPQSLDPHLATSVGAHHIMSSLLEGLMTENPKTLDPEPGVAESWVISKDRQTYTFTLRKDAKWSNGDPVKASDFVYSYRRILNQELAAQYGYMVQALKNGKLYNTGKKCPGGLWLFVKDGPPKVIAHPEEWAALDDAGRQDLLKELQPTEEDAVGKCTLCEKHAKLQTLDWHDWDRCNVGARAIDDRTLELKLENPTPYFLELLNHYTFWPVHPPTIEKFGARTKRGTGWALPGSHVGNGAFVLDEWQINARLVVKQSPTYWDRKTVKLSEIRFYPLESVDTEERAFRSRFIHHTNTVPPHRIDYHKKQNPELLHLDTYLAVYFYRFNTARKPLDDVRVRRALALSIDREALVEHVMRAGQQPAYNFTPPGTGGFTAGPQFKSDLPEAKRLIAEYLKEKNVKTLPTIELRYNTSESHKKVAEAIQAMWKQELGIDVVLDNQEWKVFLKAVEKQDFDITRAGWTGDYNDPNTFMDMWVTDGGHNNTGWSNARYDELISLAAKEGDKEKRKEYFREAEGILAKEMPMLPIYFYVRASLRDKSVKGWYPNVLDHHPYKYVYLEED